jgi:hypothetical protein
VAAVDGTRARQFFKRAVQDLLLTCWTTPRHWGSPLATSIGDDRILSGKPLGVVGLFLILVRK